MGRSPCCDEPGLKKGPWTPEEDKILVDCIGKHGHGSWRNLPKLAGLNRCGKSCRLRWTNYLRPDIRRGKFTEEEERIIINLHTVIGNKWSRIAEQLPGRTDNEIKNFWNTHLRKKLLQMGIDPTTHKPRTDMNHLMNLTQLLGLSKLSNPMNIWGNSFAMQADMTYVAKLQLLQNLLHTINTASFLNMGNPSLSLLGNRNLNPFQGLDNETRTTELLRAHSQYPNYVLPDQQQYSTQPETKLGAGTENGTHLEFVGVNHCSSASQGAVVEHLLPPLVPASSASCSISKVRESSGNQTQPSSQLPSSSVFEGWEKLMDDDSSGSCWKEILDFASTSASPFSWERADTALVEIDRLLD